MHGPDDAWKGSYDTWKTTDPRDFEPEERDEPDPDQEREDAQEQERIDAMFDDYTH
jgi:hypothetical protein